MVRGSRLDFGVPELGRSIICRDVGCACCGFRRVEHHRVFWRAHGFASCGLPYCGKYAQSDGSPRGADSNGVFQRALVGGDAPRDRRVCRPDRRPYRPQAARFRWFFCHPGDLLRRGVSVRLEDGASVPCPHRRFLCCDVVDDGPRGRKRRPPFHGTLPGGSHAYERCGNRIRSRHTRGKGIPADGAFVQGLPRGDHRLSRHGDELYRVLPTTPSRAAGCDQLDFRGARTCGYCACGRRT